MVERLSLELTNRCRKACRFCYNGSGPEGETAWTAAAAVALVRDCAAHGTRAVSLGGGEPLEHPDCCRVLADLEGALFRSVTTSGLPLEDAALRSEVVHACPDKVHVSIHHPDDAEEVERVVALVLQLGAAGLRAGVNLLVARSTVETAAAAVHHLRRAGVGPDRLILVPLRGADAPSAADLGRVAGGARFQAPSCLLGCAPSPRFASVRWDRTVAFCSYTPARRPLAAPTAAALAAALLGLQHEPCGG